MSILLELIPSLVIAAACLVVIIIVAVRFMRWLERSLPRPSSASFESRMVHDDEWDFMMDGQVIATLMPTGPPEDLNTSFIIFDIAIVPGHEPEVERLWQQFNQREPDDERICFRSRTRDGVTLKDSQVLGTLMIGGKQLSMKAYPAENEPSSDQGSSRPAT
jgi:hypothetical protein